MIKFWKEHRADVILIFGAITVSAGIMMIYLPAGIIAAGILAIVWWVLDSFDRGDVV